MKKKPVKIAGDPEGYRPEFNKPPSTNGDCAGCAFMLGWSCDGGYPCSREERPEGVNVTYVKE